MSFFEMAESFRPAYFPLVQISKNDLFAAAGSARQDSPPRADDHAVAVAGHPLAVLARLVWSEHVAKIFNGPCPQQHLPVRLSCFSCKRRRDAQHIRPR